MSLSIIIPVFNGEETLPRCFESIYQSGLSVDEFEVIVVDDCSCDATSSVVSTWRSVHPNLKYCLQEVNKRQGAARNKGLDLACGEYVFFVDADDTVGTDLKEIVTYAQECGSDIVVAKMAWQTESGGEFSYRSYNIPEKQVIPSRTFCDEYYDIMIAGSPCTSLFRRSYLQESGLWFIEGRQFEDVDWVEKVLYMSGTVSFVGLHLYNYFCNAGSTMNHFSGRRDADALSYCCRRIEFAESVASSAPRFAAHVIMHARSWINSIFSFRHMSRFSPRELMHFNRTISDAERGLMGRFCNKGFCRFAVRHESASTFVIVSCYPFAQGARFVYRKLK